MKEKIDKIKKNGKTVCLLSLLFGIIHIVPIFFGAPIEAAAFMIVTAILPVALGIIMVFSFSNAEENLFKLHNRVMHISYIDISMAITIILLAFTPRVYFSAVGAVLNVITSIGLGVTGIWILLSTYSTTRYSIIP
jgi:hypothetical protein